MPLYIVDTIVMYKMQYLVDEDCVEYAKDTITCNVDGEEVHQEYLDETIVNVFEPNMQQYQEFIKNAVNGQCAQKLTLSHKKEIT